MSNREKTIEQKKEELKKELKERLLRDELSEGEKLFVRGCAGCVGMGCLFLIVFPLLYAFVVSLISGLWELLTK